jgi:hypothetical protein
MSRFITAITESVLERLHFRKDRIDSWRIPTVIRRSENHVHQGDSSAEKRIVETATKYRCHHGGQGRFEIRPGVGQFSSRLG